MKLDIGGGQNKRDQDFISVDICGSPDVKANMWDLPFRDDSISLIWSSHTLEHAPMGFVSKTLKEWYRVCKPGGKLIVQVPNFDYIAKYWFVGQDRAWAEAMVFGNQAHDGEYHKCAFTPLTIKGDLEGNGWEVKHIEIKWSYNQETIQAVARKPVNGPEAPKAT